MKAREYFVKYYDVIVNEAIESEGKGTAELTKLLVDMLQETIDICEKRHVKLYASMENVIKEQNRKWNAIADMFANRYGSPVLKYDGFAAWIGKRLSEKLGIKEDEEPEKAGEGVEEA